MSELISKDSSIINSIVESKGEWFGGLFEVGGSIYFETLDQIKGNKRYTYTYPSLSISDSNPNKISALKKIFGGSANPDKRERSFVWRARSNLTTKIVNAMIPFAPYRKDIIDLVRLWQTVNLKERVELVELFKEEELSSSFPHQEVYKKLVTKLGFIAGIVDSRGEMENNSRLKVNTTNHPLLEALKSNYGGNIELMLQAGSTLTINGRTIIINSDAFRWTLGIGKTRELLPLIRSHLILGTVNREK